MKTKILNEFGKTILFSFITTTMINAATQDNNENIKVSPYNTNVIRTTYQSMSTERLQKEVEKHSQNGNLSFAMGQELIKRWSKS